MTSTSSEDHPDRVIRDFARLDGTTLIVTTTARRHYIGVAFGGNTDHTMAYVTLMNVRDLDDQGSPTMDFFHIAASNILSYFPVVPDAKTANSYCNLFPRLPLNLTSTSLAAFRLGAKIDQEKPAYDHIIAQSNVHVLAQQKKQKDRRMILQAQLAKQEQEREIERQNHEQERKKLADLENELAKLKEREREREEKLERMSELFYQILPYYVVRPSMTGSLPKQLKSTDAQMLVDYLSDTLNHSDILQPDERKRVLYLLCKIAKSAQVFPKAIRLTDVECDLREPVSEGGFGMIYKGKYQDETVCIKAVRMYQSGPKERVLRAHAGELVLGAHVLHPNILPFFGAFISSESATRICIVSPWMEGGNLSDYLLQNSDTPRVPLVCDILSGLHHLHEMAIVHADLKASNVFVSRMQRAVLADFGISRIAMTNVGTTTIDDSAAGSSHWMAPELLTADVVPPATRESDMWSFGCVCYEILAGKIPFEEYKLIQLIRGFMSGDLIPNRPKSIPGIAYANKIWALSKMCFDYDPKKRPTADDALNYVLELRVKDERPPLSVDPNIFLKRPRSVVENDCDALISIIRSIDRNH